MYPFNDPGGSCRESGDTTATAALGAFPVDPDLPPDFDSPCSSLSKSAKTTAHFGFCLVVGPVIFFPGSYTEL